MHRLYQLLHNCLTQFHLDYYRTLHSFKTAIGCLTGLALVWYYQWPSGQWVPITIMVVMSAQPHFGGALQRAYMRFLGTAAGVMVTLLTLITFHDNVLAVFAVTFLACGIFAYIASHSGNISYAGTLGGVTVILTLASIGVKATPELAIQRGSYIVIGIIIALLVSRFLFPIHAREALRFSIAKVLRRLKKLYFETISHNITDAILDTQLNIAYNKIVRQTQLLEEAGAGSFHFNKYKKHLFANIINNERKLYRLINLLGKSLTTNQQLKTLQISGLDALHNEIENCLENYALYFEKSALPQNLPSLTTLLQQVIVNAQQLPTDGMEIILEEHSYLFFLEQLVQELNNMYLTMEEIKR